MKTRQFAALIAITALCFGCNEKYSSSSRPLDTDSQLPANLKPQALQILTKALSSNQGAIRSAAIEIVASTNQRQLMPTVMNLTNDEFVPVRFAAAIAIGDTRYKPAESALKKLLNDNNQNAQIAAAYALYRLDNFKYRPIIINAIKSKDQTVRANAALLIGKLGDKGDLPLLYSAINELDSHDKVKMQAVESIAMIGDEKIYKKLWALMISKFSDDRVIAIRAMGMIDTSDAHDSIMTMLYDHDPWVRLTAVDQLAKKGNKIGKYLLMDHLRDMPGSIKDSKVENTDILAAAAIGRFNEPDITAFLPNLIDSRSTIIQLNAAWSVLKIAN